MNIKPLGVVVVTYNARTVILDCLETLLAAAAADAVPLQLVIVDNASTDGTADLVRNWASGQIRWDMPDDLPFECKAVAKPLMLGDATQSISVTLLENSANGGFAYGVNTGLAHLARDPQIERFWVLNPDSAVPPRTPLAFATYDAGPFSLMGSRLCYYDDPNIIQIDGGTINRKTGVTSNLGQYQTSAATPAPEIEQIDFISGASMVASRAFYEAAGPMPENYFLYYEEVDWALQRGAMPLAYCPGGVVYHKAGASIGSASLNRPASPFSVYFKHRARLQFVRKFFASSLFSALAYSCAKAGQLLLKGYPNEASALIRASFGMQPSAKVRAMLSPDAAKFALNHPKL